MDIKLMQIIEEARLEGYIVFLRLEDRVINW
jgi:hypothetical protein